MSRGLASLIPPSCRRVQAMFCQVTQQMMMLRLREFAIGLIGLGAAGACTAAGDATQAARVTPDVRAETSGARPGKGALPSPSTPAGGSGNTSPIPSVGAPAPTVDTVRPRLISGRSKHDSIAYASAVAYGRTMLANWPTAPAPIEGSLLPSHRIIAFYGNPVARKMGVLGEYPVDEMLAKLDTTVDEWQRADPITPALPALQLIAVTAQPLPGRDRMYRLRMDTSLIEKVYGWAQRKHGLLFLDVQLGHSTMQQELPRLLPFLSRPDVHLAIDPEFSMHHSKEGVVPGKKFGQVDATDVNWACEQLRQLVVEKHLPPKVLIIHRFRTEMVSNAKRIHLDPHVQIVMDMDGFGPPWQKFESYRDYIDAEPVEFTGFKLFFHNDAQGRRPLLTPLEVLGLQPRPLYIQYQ